MSAKLAWFDEAVTAVEAARSQPKFPGEQSPIYVILEKLVNKLWGECHDGDAVGTGRCAVCRAFRTEVAEAAAEAAKAAAQNAAEDLNETQLTLYAANERAADLFRTVEGLQAELADQAAEYTALVSELAAAKSDLEAERQERGEAQQNLAAQTAALNAATENAATFQRLYANLYQNVENLL